jgi:FkbM family methyltransferase
MSLKLAKTCVKAMVPGSAMPFLKTVWAKYSLATFRPRVARHRYGAYEFSVQLLDRDGALMLDHDHSEAAFAEIDVLCTSRLKRGARVFDVGANSCIQAMMMAMIVGPDGVVFALEPNQANVRASAQNLKLNNIVNCEILPVAASDQPGRILFNSSMNGQVAKEGEFGAHYVEAVTIDALTEQKGPPDVLYIDVEGFECQVLAGSRDTIERYRPDCFVEVHVGLGLEKLGGSVKQILSYFPTANYALHYSNGEDGKFHKVSDPDGLPDSRFYLVATRQLQSPESKE